MLKVLCTWGWWCRQFTHGQTTGTAHQSFDSQTSGVLPAHALSPNNAMSRMLENVELRDILFKSLPGLPAQP